jgi:hypothetical protein
MKDKDEQKKTTDHPLPDLSRDYRPIDPFEHPRDSVIFEKLLTEAKSRLAQEEALQCENAPSESFVRWLDMDLAAPPGKVRVIGFDTFTVPLEEFLIGDFDSLEEALGVATKSTNESISTHCYDDEGVKIASRGPMGNKPL